MQQLLWSESGLLADWSCDTNFVLNARAPVCGGEGTHCLNTRYRICKRGIQKRYNFEKVHTLVNPTLRTVAPISMAVPTAPSKSSFLEREFLMPILYVFHGMCMCFFLVHQFPLPFTFWLFSK